MNRRIAVLGSNSFSGSDLIDLLLQDPRREVVGASRSPEKTSLFLPYKRRATSRFKFLQVDLNTQLPDLLALLDRFEPSVVVNFAAQSEVGPSWDHPDHWLQTNVVGVARLAQALKTRRYLERYVHISSPEVYGTCHGRVTEDAPLNPSTPYAVSKAAGDLFLMTLARQRGFPVILVRATNVYGAHQQLFKIIPRAVILLKQGRRIPLHGGGAAVKSYIHIRDVSRGELAIIDRGLPGAIYHLSPDAGCRVRDVVRSICALIGRDFESATIDVADRLGQDAAYLTDSCRARTEFGWAPQVPLDEGLQEVVTWIESNWDVVQQEPLEYAHRP